MNIIDNLIEARKKATEQYNSSVDFIQGICGEFERYTQISPKYYEKYDVKRGLRNHDGTGVMAGVTLIGNVKGYVMEDGEKTPAPGRLYSRGINVEELIDGFTAAGRFGFEETAYLLMFGGLPTKEELEQVMEEFAAGEQDVLVATTIIESGIDNPHTNTLVIEDSQRLGLAQLYQLKGRVGRGCTQAYAYFLCDGDKPLTEEATERLTAINEYQDLGSGMRVAMRDLEIRGAGSLVGAEQHGNLQQVGFDLFTQMLGAAVSEARGEVGDVEPPEVTVNLSADFYFSDEYVPEIDKRVMAYRRVAAATELEQVDRLESDLAREHGDLPEAARNLLDRQRIRIRAERLGVTSVALTGGRFVFLGYSPDRDVTRELKAKGALVYPKTAKVAYPHRAGDDVVAGALAVLEAMGGDDGE